MPSCVTCALKCFTLTFFHFASLSFAMNHPIPFASLYPYIIRTLLGKRTKELEDFAGSDTKGYLVDMIADILLYNEVATSTTDQALKARLLKYLPAATSELGMAQKAIPDVVAEAKELAKAKHAERKPPQPQQQSPQPAQQSQQRLPQPAAAPVTTPSPAQAAAPTQAAKPAGNVTVSLDIKSLHSVQQIEFMMLELVKGVNPAQLPPAVNQQLTLLRKRKKSLERLCTNNTHKYLVDLLKDVLTYSQAIKTCDEATAAKLKQYIGAMGMEVQLAKDNMMEQYTHAERVARSQLPFLNE
eukprot:m.247973 g.247973  ORF g.247973 m.247973 type:complete len:299 (+) comp15404_c0_seq1:2652-3548(+)